MKNITIPAGSVLTLALLKKVNPAAYQYGGFKVKGEVLKKSAFSLDVKTQVLIPLEFIKIDPDKFLLEFSKTMNSWYYEIKFI